MQMKQMGEATVIRLGSTFVAPRSVQLVGNFQSSDLIIPGAAHCTRRLQSFTASISSVHVYEDYVSSVGGASAQRLLKSVEQF